MNQSLNQIAKEIQNIEKNLGLGLVVILSGIRSIHLEDFRRRWFDFLGKTLNSSEKSPPLPKN